MEVYTFTTPPSPTRLFYFFFFSPPPYFTGLLHLSSHPRRQSFPHTLAHTKISPAPTIHFPLAGATAEKSSKLAAVDSDMAEAEALIRRMDLEARELTVLFMPRARATA